MTAQVPDQFLHEGECFDVTAFSAEEPFDPTSLGLKPVSNCTACWRGYMATYSIFDGKLVIEHLAVELWYDDMVRPKPRVGPVINGVTPKTPTDEDALFNNEYFEVRVPLDYSGGILIAKDFIDDLYVHMGFHPAWKYQIVHELIFDKGRFVSASDKSLEMKALRQTVSEGELDGPGVHQPEEHIAWIERCFDRRYTF